MVNSSLCLSANCARNAQGMKPYLGKHAYTVQTLIELYRRRRECYDVLIDKASLEQNPNAQGYVKWRENFDTQLFMVYNGKFGGGRIMLNPLAYMNDGYFEAVTWKNRFSFSTALDLFSQAKNGATQVYDDESGVIRAKKVKLINKKTEDDANGQKSFVPQDVNIDGEDLIFRKQITYECIPQHLEVMVDFKWVLNHFLDAKL